MSKDIQLAILWGGARHGANFVLEEKCNFLAFEDGHSDEIFATRLTKEELHQIPEGIEELLYARINFNKTTLCGVRVSLFISGDAKLDKYQKRAIESIVGTLSTLTLDEIKDTELRISISESETIVSFDRNTKNNHVTH